MFIQNLKTRYGCFRILISKRGVKALFFPKNKNRRISLPDHRSLKHKIDSGKHFFSSFAFLKVLQNYFAGQSVSFREWPIDWSDYSPFERRVLRACLTIPFGKTVTYLDLAKKIGNRQAARAVGNALGRNRIPILIPCHRITRSDGALGGYTAGIKWKRRLLGLEGVTARLLINS